MNLLEPDGILMFSNNFRRFKLDASLGDVIKEKKGGKGVVDAKSNQASGADAAVVVDAQVQYKIEERSYWSLDDDFQRNARIHQCWFIKHIQES